MKVGQKKYVIDIDTDLDTLFGTEGRYGPEGKTFSEIIAEQKKNMTPAEREAHEKRPLPEIRRESSDGLK